MLTLDAKNLHPLIAFYHHCGLEMSEISQQAHWPLTIAQQEGEQDGETYSIEIGFKGLRAVCSSEVGAWRVQVEFERDQDYKRNMSDRED